MTFHDLLLNKNWLKVFSLVVAMLIYFVIQTNVSPTDVHLVNPLNPTATREFHVPVILLTSATNRRLFQIEPAEVRVNVRGDAAMMDQLAPEDVQVLVRLVDVADAEGIFRLEAKVPPEFNAQVIMSPASVRVKTLRAPTVRPDQALP